MVVAGCHKGTSPPAGEQATARATERTPSAIGSEDSRPSTLDVPAWAPLHVPDGPPAEPTRWKPDGRPTLVVFSASWCPGCTASATEDRALVRDHGTAFQIGVALAEPDESFTASRYARALSGVPVWSEESTERLVDACHPRGIPMACLFDRGKVLWTGGASEAHVVAEQYRAGYLDSWLDAADRRAAEARRIAEEALVDPSRISEVVALTHGRAEEQNNVAWDLIDQEAPTPNEIALAVALSRDAVASNGGIDFTHLDTYAVALAKASRADEAAHVGARVLEVCEAVQGRCPSEKQRALDLIARAGGSPQR